MNTTKTQKTAHLATQVKTDDLRMNNDQNRVRGEYIELKRSTKTLCLTEADIREIERKIDEQFQKEFGKGSAIIRMLEIQTKHLHVPRGTDPKVKSLKKK